MATAAAGITENHKNSNNPPNKSRNIYLVVNLRASHARKYVPSTQLFHLDTRTVCDVRMLVTDFSSKRRKRRTRRRKKIL